MFWSRKIKKENNRSVSVFSDLSAALIISATTVKSAVCANPTFPTVAPVTDAALRSHATQTATALTNMTNSQTLLHFRLQT